jgi:hypothetical protein
MKHLPSIALVVTLAGGIPAASRRTLGSPHHRQAQRSQSARSAWWREPGDAP